MQLVLIYSKSKLSGKLTKFWTGEYAYHIGFLDADSDTFYDMHLIPRKTSWAEHGYKDFTLHPTNLSVADCEDYLKEDSFDVRYSPLDYTLFSVRGVYHFFGKSTPNAKGDICSEMVNNWEWRKQFGATPWPPAAAPPSPADFVRFFKGKL